VSKDWFKTTVKHEKDMEIFETQELGSDEEDQDDSELENSAEENEPELKKEPKSKSNPAPTVEAKAEGPDYDHLVKGVDIIDDAISTERAYSVFRDLEKDEAALNFKPPRLAETGGVADGRLQQEVPSIRIQRLQSELEELQKELTALEKEEIPTRRLQSAKHSLQSIDELRAFMHKVVESTAFQDLETRSNLDMTSVLQKAYRQHVSEATGKNTEMVGGNTQDLKAAIQLLLSHNVAKLDASEMIKGAQVSNEIELLVKMEQSPDEVEKFKS